MHLDIQQVVKAERRYYLCFIEWEKFNLHDADSKQTANSKKLVDISIGNTTCKTTQKQQYIY